MAAITAVDTAKLVEKFAIERQKRLRKDGTKQYFTLRDSKYKALTEDPFLNFDAVRQREKPNVRDGDFHKVIILGAGHNGLITAARLIEAGMDTNDILLIDNAGGFGGTWYWNRYPGLMCDVEAYIYLPLLEETGFVPTYKYSYGEEIRSNAETIAAKYKLNALFTTTATSMKWQEDRARWVVQLTRKLGPDQETTMQLSSTFLFIASGVLAHPHMPKLPGIDDYLQAGQIFHTSRWNYKLTGGSQEDPKMEGLRGKNVAVIGTGATSVQAIPQVAKYAKEVYVFQRTPSFVGPRNQKRTTPEDWSKVAVCKGWQVARTRNFESQVTNDPEPQDLVSDGWSESHALAAFAGGKSIAPVITKDNVQEHVKYFVDLDAKRTTRIRARTDEVISNKAVADNLKAWYAGWCKRPVFNDDYLDCFNQPNVTLVDTDGKGVERFTSRGLVAQGVEYEVDIVILGTGFETMATSTPSTRSKAEIIGKGGSTITDKFTGSDFNTLHGLMTNGFPNLFFNNMVQQAIAFNITSQYEISAKHFAEIVTKSIASTPAGKTPIIEATIDQETEWGQEVAKRSMFFATLPICTPGYFVSEGDIRPTETPEQMAYQARHTHWSPGLIDFNKRLEEFRAAQKWREMLSYHDNEQLRN